MGTAVSIRCCVENAAPEEIEDEAEKEAATVKLCPQPWHSRHLPPPPPSATKVQRSISNATTLPS
jgi:hypothetical protein